MAKLLTGSEVRMSSPLSRVLGFKRAQRAVHGAGDRARDAKRWSETAEHYAAYLKKNPNDVPIRVQLGNCLKEAGQLTNALDAYKTGRRTPPNWPLLKILGHSADAIQAYRASIEL